MQIAIIGRGFAGLALAYYLSNNPANTLYIFDENDLGVSASGTACGLLHPFSGAKSRRSWMADVGMKTAIELIDFVEAFLQENISERKGILRPAVDSEQLNDFKIALSKNHDMKWLSQEETLNKIPSIKSMGSLFIPTGISIYANDYLRGLFEICKSRGARLVKEKITSLKNLAHFDAIIVAAGSKTTSIEELKDLPLRRTKGQILELLWPSHLACLPCAIVSHAYMAKAKDPKKFYLGATYERSPVSEEVDIETAKSLLLPKASKLIDEIKEAIVVDCKAGFRMFSPDNITPIAGKTSYKNTWVLSGLGSKGLLHHAWIAKALSSAIMKNDTNELPKELYFRL
jgi:glycine/D-amino acid oxidase-like deaminating enzyme